MFWDYFLRPFFWVKTATWTGRSVAISISHSQQDKSVQAKPSIIVAFLVICWPQIFEPHSVGSYTGVHQMIANLGDPSQGLNLSCKVENVAIYYSPLPAVLVLLHLRSESLQPHELALYDSITFKASWSSLPWFPSCLWAHLAGLVTIGPIFSLRWINYLHHAMMT